MKSTLRALLLLLLVNGTFTQLDFNLADAVDDVAPTPAKPKEKPKDNPKIDDGFGLDLEDAIAPDPKPQPQPKPDVPADKPKSGGGDFGFDLEDAFAPDPKPQPKPKPDVPADKPKSGGGGSSFDDSDLLDVSDDGAYKPDAGRGGGRSSDPGYDPQGGADQPQEAASGPIAGIVSAIGVALLGAASSYFAYQKKKLCFKLQGGADPESGKVQQGDQSDPQVYSNLLRTS